MNMNSGEIVLPQEPPVAGGEVETLLGELERLRRYVAWKCGNLDAAGLRTTHQPSAITLGGLNRPAAFSWPDGRTPNLRRLLIDMIEEYARHVGQADLIRESIDGLVGEDQAMPHSASAAVSRTAVSRTAASRTAPEPITADQLTIVPANEASWADLQAVFGVADYPGRCYCQRYKTEGWHWALTDTVRRDLLRSQTNCDDPQAPATTGLVAYRGITYALAAATLRGRRLHRGQPPEPSARGDADRLHSPAVISTANIRCASMRA